eukprot:4360387-Prymnesium_polylepis.2
MQTWRGYSRPGGGAEFGFSNTRRRRSANACAAQLAGWRSVSWLAAAVSFQMAAAESFRCVDGRLRIGAGVGRAVVQPVPHVDYHRRGAHHQVHGVREEDAGARHTAGPRAAPD